MHRHVVMTSGGATSWEAARRVKEKFGIEGLTMLFADTRMEDEDLYRFLVESCANIAGVPVPDCAYLQIPPIESGRLAERKEALAWIQREAMVVIPGLVWLADGRTPWEVFRDERFLGNSRVDPCSKILKRQLMDAWRDANCKVDETTLYVGLDWTEMHRVERYLERVHPWRAVAPLMWEPLLAKPKILERLSAAGVRPPRLYEFGFAHNNCGGFCCKAGHGAFLNLLEKMPERYVWHAQQEADLMRDIGTDCTMLTDRRGGAKKPLSLWDLRERASRAPEDIDRHDIGGCGCALG